MGDVSDRVAEVRAREEAAAAAVQLQDVTNWASGLVVAAINVDVDDLLTPDAAALWEIGGRLLEHAAPGSHHQRLAQLYMLTALERDPAALAGVVRNLRAQLLEADPLLQSLWAPHQHEEAGDATV